MKKKVVFSIALLIICCFATFAQASTEVASEAVTETQVFVDDLGRSVTLPANISRVAPSGSNAQVIVFQIAPEKLVGLSSKLTNAEKEIYPKYTHDLPAFGTLYGKKANLNRETLILANPEVIIDVGDIKGSVEDMVKELDDVSSEVGVPVIFIEANMHNYDEVFLKLGELLNCQGRALQLAKYYQNVVELIKEIRENAENKQPRVYITSSNDGLYAILGGKSHSECAEMAGAEVVVTSSLVQSNGNISLETLYMQDPEYIFTYTQEGYDTVTSSRDWANISAVQNGKVYLVPSMPHGFIDSPVCSNRIVGLYYLASIFYPEAGIDIVERTKEFYSLFYGKDLDDEAIKEILYLN